jgi:hypothetical protein
MKQNKREKVLTSNGLGTSEFELLAYELGRQQTLADMEPIADALKSTLVYFALFNDEPNKTRWPKYIHRCESALAIFQKLKSEGVE